ncbi:MAG TPA: MFS transporter, partial [Caulobacteraceae bacterium]|nr:MFS transporter [Caulobacteraceae bacterium]
AIAAITWPGLIAPVLGPFVGGLLATYASWRWVFFLNVPLGIVAAWLAHRYTPEHREEHSPRFDVAGFLLTAVALGGLIYGLDLLGQQGESHWAAGALVVASVGFGVAAVVHARRRPHPLLDLRAVYRDTFRQAITTTGFVGRLAMSGTPFLIPLLFQLGFGYTAFEAGLMILVYMAGNLAMKTVTTPILRRCGFRRVLIGANLATAATLVAYALFTPATPKPLIWVLLFAGGLSRSMTFTATNTLTFADVAPEERSGATALSSMLQQVSMSLGVALAALALNLGLSIWHDPQPMLPEFRFAFLCLAGFAAVSAFGFLRLDPAAGAEVSGHRRDAGQGAQTPG